MLFLLTVEDSGDQEVEEPGIADLLGFSLRK
jgi:hypothetical protein